MGREFDFPFFFGPVSGRRFFNVSCTMLFKLRSFNTATVVLKKIQSGGGGARTMGVQDIQGDQLYMAVGYWYLVKRVLSSVRYCTVW